MPTKTGASHGMSAFVTLIAGALLSKYLWGIVPPLGEASLTTMKVIRSTTGIDVPVSEQFAGMVVVMVGLSFVWGIFYHYGRHS